MTDASGRGGSLEGEAIEIRLRDGTVHAACSALGIHASAPTADAALAALGDRLAELRAFEDRSGLAVASRLARPGQRRREWLRRIGVPVLIGGFVAMQLGWAIALGISNGFGHAFDSKRRADVLLGLERQLLRLAEPSSSRGQEEQARLIAAAKALKARYGPVWKELMADPPAAAK